MKKVFAVLLLCVSAYACAQTKVDPGRINWPTGAAGCVYAPETNTCVTAGGSGISGTYALTGVMTLANGSVQSVGPAFAMTISCTAAGSFEVGYATTNPNVCTLGYSNGTPASGTIGDGTHSTTLTTPFTSGNLAYQYCTAGQGVTSFTFTGNATSTTSQTASASTGVNCLPREFGGVGTAGATGATASGTSAVLVGATGTLASAGLGTQNTWGPYAPTNQYIYVIGTSSSCTFTLGGFSFLMHTPVAITFTNQYTGAIPMWSYQSVNPQTSSSLTLTGGC